MNTLEGQKSGARFQENYRKPTEVAQPCEENERGAHSEKNARCGHTREKKMNAAKPKMERRMQEIHDRGGSERGQDNKQGSMEEYHHQLYRRPQVTRQDRGEEDEEEERLVRAGCKPLGKT